MTLTLPPFLLFGYWGFTPFPRLMFISSAQRNNAALIAHEQCHQFQQRRDGWFTFWFKYLTSKSARFNYELEAYKVWLKVQPEDFNRVSYWLAHNYGLDMSFEQVRDMLQT